jgi:branched-chain amino acid transport system substrate-binding protein
MGVEIRFTDNKQLVASIVSSLLLPLSQKLLDTYADWKRGYLFWGATYRYWQELSSTPTHSTEANINNQDHDEMRSVSPPASPIETNISIQSCNILEKKLVEEFNNWLSKSSGLSQVRESLLVNVPPEKYKNRPELSLILQINNDDSQINLELQRLPWNEWKFIHDNYNTGIALSTKTVPIVTQQYCKLKVLVICGNYTDEINVEPDLASIKRYLGDAVELEIWMSDSKKKSKRELLGKLEDSAYNLLFFCGHSSSNTIQLNDYEHISVDDNDFVEILTELKNKGLLLAFFNSCDGLKIAQSLNSIGIPYVVAMKEFVHDRVAQIFIEKFLEKAIQPGIPIHVAVNLARQSLRKLQELPHGELLPVLFINPEQSQSTLYLNQRIIPTVDSQPELPSDERWWIRWLKSRRVKYLTIAIMSAFATLILAVYPYSKMIISTWMSPPICKFAYDTKHISCGEEIILIKPNGTSSGNKINGFSSVKEGVKNPSTSTYQKAIVDLKKDWQSGHDPETAIAIENATIALKSIDNLGIKIKNIAVVVPAQQNTPYYVADSLLKGVAYAQKQQNSKDDWKLRVLIADDANDKNQSQEIAQKLVDRRDILGVIGHYSSNVTIPIVNNNTYRDKTVLISSTATADELNSKNAEKFFFRLAPSSNFSAEGMVKKWMKPERKIVLFYQSSEGKFSLSLRQAFKEAIMKDGKYSINNNIVKEFDLSKSNNIKNEIEQAKKANANSIVLFPDAYTGDNKTNNKAEEVMVHNKGEMPILANTSVYDSYEQKYRTPSITVLPELYKNVVMSIPWEYSNRKTRYSQELILQDDPNQLPAIPKWWLFDSESIDRLNQRIVLSHDAALVLIEAIQRAEDADRGDDNRYIKKIIANRNFEVEGITGKISFNGSSDRVEQMDSLVTPDCNEKECKGFRIYKNK